MAQTKREIEVSEIEQGLSSSQKSQHKATHPRSQNIAQRSDALFLLAVVFIGLTLRLDFIIPCNWVVDADEAIVGLMAKHMSEGAPIPVFYYGQNYMGSFEPLLVSFLFRIFGVSSWALKLVPLIFSLLLIPLAYRIGEEFESRFVARVSAFFMAVPPVALVVWSAKARGGFIELVYIGALALLICIRWLKRDDIRLLPTVAMALLLGFGWWVNNQIIFFMLPIGLGVLSKLFYLPNTSLNKKCGYIALHLSTGLAAFLIGGAPFWIYNLHHHFVSFEMFKSAGGSDVFSHLQGLLKTSLPIIFGAKRFWDPRDIFFGSSAIAYILNGALLFALIVKYRQQCFDLFRLKVTPHKPVAFLLSFVMGTCLVFVLSSFGHLVQAPRYLLPAYVGLFTLLAYSIHCIRETQPVIAWSFFGALTLFHLGSGYIGERAIPGEPIVFGRERVARDQSELIQWLDAHKIRFIRTNYWIGYRLAFETNERIRFLVYQEPRQTRIESYQEEGRKIGEEFMPLVVTPTQAVFVETAMAALGYRFQVDVLSGYRVIHDIRLKQENLVPVNRSAFIPHASVKDERAPLAVDGTPETRWGSGEPQTHDLSFSLEFPTVQTLRGFKLDISGWETDYPRGMQIEAELADGSRLVLLNEVQYSSLRYFTDKNSTFSLVFDPISVRRLILTDTGREKVFDWSIGEITVYQ